ncbi:hypothetical protein M427DRAFT_62017 [Gonapodya prolifera JEL478]|uniref:SnoaL-like domain-containing protein n=1 Tax=Gonapodya prolifera (strain JEL478) TaxID=1344416 RepID=A0A139A1S5_GONPJ|nr:hypothetical protein M427DRAFT_62017 [Gonapodya prolifera JEL478]|eukprot:KXS10495.1 hypothetical protein M427DRAFT_62017 [Gonapodya prolifera JEL478]
MRAPTGPDLRITSDTGDSLSSFAFLPYTPTSPVPPSSPLPHVFAVPHRSISHSSGTGSAIAIAISPGAPGASASGSGSLRRRQTTLTRHNESRREKEVARQFMERMGPGIQDAMETLVDRERLLVQLLPKSIGAPAMDYDSYLSYLCDDFLPRFKEFRMTPLDYTCEGDKVHVEAESLGVTHDGRVYNQEHDFIFVVRHGKIVTIREYVDSHHFMAFFPDFVYRWNVAALQRRLSARRQHQMNRQLTNDSEEFGKGTATRYTSNMEASSGSLGSTRVGTEGTGLGASHNSSVLQLPSEASFHASASASQGQRPGGPNPKKKRGLGSKVKEWFTGGGAGAGKKTANSLGSHDTEQDWHSATSYPGADQQVRKARSISSSGA